MAGTTISFIADAKLAARVKEIARSDGITQSQAVARASALGAILPAAARRTLRFVLTEGGDEAQEQLATAITKAIAQIGNRVLERRLQERAHAPGLAVNGETDEAIEARVEIAIAENRRQFAEDDHGPGHSGRSDTWTGCGP